jgi:sugar lactone lactonase YvrE
MRSLCALLAILHCPLLIPRAAQAAQQPDSIRSLDAAFQLAGRASEARDWKTVRAALETALRLSPDHPAALYSLARAEARLGDGSAAVRTLERLATQGAVRPVADDTAFASLRRSTQFRQVAQRLAAGATPMVRSDTSFVLPDPDFIPEGIAWDPADGAFYVGSLAGRGIVRVVDGRASAWVRTDSTRLVQILGLRVDRARRRLWVAALIADTAAPRFFREPGGWASVEAYQLPTGKLLGRWAPDSSGPHLLNDIAITPAGDVYVTDSEGGALQRLRGGEGRLEPVHIDRERFLYPNGIATSADGSRLYVAHFEGLSWFDLRASSLAPTRLRAPAGVATAGIDGLYQCADGLVAVQYMLDFPQITWFALSGDGASITAAKPLERRHPSQSGPTTGAVSGGALHYIANAQLERLGDDQSVKPGKGERSVVLRLPLGDACAA